MSKQLIACVGLLVASLAAYAAPSELVLDVKGMTCSTCPITVRAVLKKLPGVEEAKVDGEKHIASVKFDSTRVSPEAIAKAVTEAGFPAVPRK